MPRPPRPFPLRSILAGLALGLLALMPIVATGCSAADAERTLSPINAEHACLDHTRAYAASYVKEHPAEKVEVDDFYASWSDRLAKEAAAAPDAAK